MTSPRTARSLIAKPDVICLNHGRLQRIVNRDGKRLQVCEGCGWEVAVIEAPLAARPAVSQSEPLLKRSRINVEPDTSCRRHGHKTREVVRSGAFVLLCEECGYPVTPSALADLAG